MKAWKYPNGLNMTITINIESVLLNINYDSEVHGRKHRRSKRTIHRTYCADIGTDKSNRADPVCCSIYFYRYLMSTSHCDINCTKNCWQG